MIRNRFILGFTLALCVTSMVLIVPQASALTTVPLTNVYNGHLLNSSGLPVTTSTSLRFSYWSDDDFVTGDVTGGGAINTAATTYANWFEVHTVTPNADGYFSVDLGSVTPLPAIDTQDISTLLNLFLQTEAKTATSPDTAYEVLDVNASDSTVDRSPILSVPFAQNADFIDQREIGTSSGNIMILGSGGVFPTSVIPGGTDADTFVIDADNSVGTGSINLTFGDSLGKTLSYDLGNTYFNFNDDVNIEGDLTVTGLINGVDITSLATTDMHLRVTSGGGLNVNIALGSYRLNGAVTNFAGSSSILLADNATSYLYFTEEGMVISGSTYPTDESIIRLAQVTTLGGSVTAISDHRILQTDDRERLLERIFSPGYEGAAYQGDTTNNVGQLGINHDTVADRNFYVWSTTKPTLQDYDILLKVPVTPDFVGWSDPSITLAYRSTSASAANNSLDIFVFDSNGTPVTLSGSVTGLASTSWTTAPIEFTGSPVWTPGTQFLIQLRVSALTGFEMHLGELKIRSKEFLAP